MRIQKNIYKLNKNYIWDVLHERFDFVKNIQICGKPIVIMSPLHRLNEKDPAGDGRDRKLEVRAPLSRYREILLEVAAYYALPVLDLYLISGMQPAHNLCRERLMPDGLHPSDEGHAIIAKLLANFLKML